MSLEAETSSPATKAQKSVSFWLASAAVAITNLAVTFDASTLADIGSSSVKAFQAGTTYPLAQMAFMLLWVSLSQSFGRRPIFVLTLVLFGIGAVLAAVAHTYTYCSSDARYKLLVAAGSSA